MPAVIAAPITSSDDLPAGISWAVIFWSAWAAFHFSTIALPHDTSSGLFESQMVMSPRDVTALLAPAVPPIVVAPHYRLAFRVLEMPAGAYFRKLWPAVSSTAIMALAVGIVQVVLPHTLDPVTRLVIEVLVGIMVYGAMIAWRHRARALAFVSIVREHAR